MLPFVLVVLCHNFTWLEMPASVKKPKTSTSSKETVINDVHSKTTKEFYEAEDKVASSLDAEKEETSVVEQCRRLKTLIGQLAETNSGTARTELKDQITVSIMILRRHSRLAHMRNRIMRDRSIDERHKSDEQYLRLQNLVHEVQHLQKEVNKCLEFKSADEGIDLVPEEEFYEKAPAEISKPDVTKKSKHDLKLARLRWELEERKLLKEQLKNVQEQRSVTAKEIESKSQILDKLKPQVETILVASRPLQECLGMNYEEVSQQRRMAMYLPTPLCYFYTQIGAYKQIFEDSVDVSIKGEIELAKRKNESKSATQSPDDSDDDEEILSQEKDEMNTDDRSNSRQKRKRKPTVTEVVERLKEKILEVHPLHLEMSVRCSGELTVYLSFYYLTDLQVVGVKCRSEFKEVAVRNVASAGNLLLDETVLQHLYDGDCGTVCPNPVGQKSLDYSRIELTSEVGRLGHMYYWAQNVTGLFFGDTTTTEDRQQNINCCDRLREVLSLIRNRINARMTLQQDIGCLEQFRIAPVKQLSDWFPTKIVSRLTSWKSLTADDFKYHPATASIVLSMSIPSDGWFFSTSIERSEAKLMALIRVGPAYPQDAPLFVLVLKWKSTRPSSESDPLRALEEAVNIHCPQTVPHKHRNHLLSIQMMFLLSRMDLLLEVESARLSLKDFTRDHLFGRKARGPGREIPLDFSESTNSFNFL